MARCSLCLHLLSVLFLYLINEGFSADFEGTCEKPKAPSSVKLKCKFKADTLECSAKCRNKGTVFPNGGTRQTFNCKTIEGGWPEGFTIPECEDKCDPPCENQGKCSKKKCICTPDYRGPNCQYSKSLCDPSTSLEFSGIAHCNHTSTMSLCTFDCPKETMFQSQPADSYKCSMDGVWDPSDIPNCVPVNLLDEMAPVGTETLLQVETKTSGVCAAWGRSHFRTFDGLLFSFRGPCTYLLSKDCSTNSFSIHLRVDPFCTEEICKKYVTVYLGDVRYDLDYENGNIVVKREEEILPVPGSVEGLHLEKPTDYLILRSSSGFRLTWDGKDTILLSINDRLKNNTCGLCGQHDGIVQNDLQMLDGKIAPQVASFVNSWKMNELGEKCQDSVNQENICSYKTEEEKIISQRADVECSVIYNAEYTPCHDLVNPKPYFTACRNEYCACKSPDNTCKCNTLAEYFRECIRLGGKIHGGWRNESVCPLDCPVGMEYFDCGSSCPKTCTKTEYDCEDEHCVDGCHCPAGTALYEGDCIPESKCPCPHSNKQYQNGERITKDCNTCECQGGNWQCTVKECERRCTSAGDPHYTTFDGTKYEFMGTCSYYLVYNESFSIIQNNENCRTLGLVRKNGAPYGDRASCTKSLTINYGNNKVIFKHGAEVSVNGQDVKDFPFSNKDINIMHGTSNLLTLDIPNLLTIIWDGKNRVYVDAAASLHNSVTGLCGTLNNNQNDDFLTPDGNVEIDVSKFADKWKTDPTCSEELQNIDTRDSCDINPQKKETSEELCSILKSDLFKECHDDVDPDPFFKDCLYDMCACAVKAKECLCPSMDNYAATCAKKGVIVSWKSEVPLCQTPCHGGQIYQECSNPCQLNCKSISMGEKCVKKCIQGCACPEGMTMGNDGICIPIIECPCFFKDMEYAPNAMRTNGKTECDCKNAKWECRVSEKHNATKVKELMMSDVGQYCDSELHLEYSDCLDCPVTCENYFTPTKLCENNACRQGCGCQPGYILEDIYAQSCIKPTACRCTHGGKKYPNGSTRKRDCRTCVCKSGQWKCEEKNCPGFCSSWGGSHFKTFDGHLYEFQGDCEYVLTEFLKTDDIDSFRITIKNEECGTSGITCIKTVKFYLGEFKVILSENEPLPRPNYNSRLIVRKVGLYVFVYSNIGIILQWDRRSRVSIQANPSWRGKLTGLCGNFNDDRLDDFKSPAGGLVEARAVVFGHSWRLYESCPYPLDITDPCTVSRKQFATTQCGILKSDVFKPCHLAVPLTPYFDRCVSDTCGCDKGGDCECLCTAISAYAYECSIQGIYIKWRTQDLCPVQCEECGRYEPCISTCPKMTCETKFLYSGLNDLCTNEPCVDGCEPKPCPVGQIFNNDNDFKCIPEEECKVHCKEINGILYYEGELIQDVSVGDGCQTCYCRRGNISCIGQPCSTPLPFCYKNGWTEWINTPPTITGDYELIKDLKIPCSTDKITDIECRLAGTEISSKNPLKFQSQKLICDTSVGLRCSNAEQTTGKCEDFEVKVYCDCSQFTTVPTTPSIRTEKPEILPIPECTAPGWTFWMNSVKPTDEGEDEDISTIRKFYKFCPDEEITDVQCRIASSGIDSEFTNEDVECTKKGVFCKTSSVGVRCSDYEIRFYCLCEGSECSDPRGMKKGEILDSQIRVSSFTGRNNKARLNSEYYWRSKLNSSTEWIEINLGEVQNITGIITQGHPFADEWVTSYVVLYGDDKFNFKTILDEDGKKKKFRGNEDRDTVVTQYLPTKLRTKFIRIYPQDWFNWITMRIELLGCNVKVPIRVTTTPPIFSTSPVPTSPTVCVQGWTEYYDTDDPSTDDGDTENITYIKAVYGICKGGVISEVQCVTEVGGELVDYTESGDSSLKCSRITGFVCINFMQRKTKKCKNYKIRLYCDCGELTTLESVISTVYIPPPCIQGWTEYYNTNNPWDGEGDFELLTELIEKYKFCQADQVRNVECKALILNGGVKSELEMTQVDWTESGDEVTCNVEEGLVCFNNAQGKGKRCKDYAVRFYCQCENLPVKVNPCDWSSWINFDNPRSSIYDVGDVENIEIAQKENDLCQKPALKEIQCRDAKTLKDYTETGQNNLVCDPEVGFKCYNKFQKESCYDYEYRVFCFYDWCTSRTPRIETVPPEVSTEVTSPVSTEISSQIPSELTSRVSTEIITPSTSPCPPNEIYHECAYDCNFLCLSYLEDLRELKLCTEEIRCVAGCRPQIECKSPYFWRDSRTCVHIKDCTCVLENGKIIAPGSSETYKCEKCQCYNNTLSCHEIPNCGKSTPTPLGRYVCSNSSLGIEDGSISIDQIVVSSQLYPATKDRIRLNTNATESGNGGWASEFNDRFQYVQIDFLEPKNITGVITQGENGLSNWVREYTVDYSKDGVSWQYIVENGKTKKFKGNFDSDTAVTNYFPRMIETRFLKIIPVSWNNWISMRIDVLGCLPISNNFLVTREPVHTTVSEGVKGYSKTILPGSCVEKMGFSDHTLPTSLITVSSSRSPLSDASRIALETQSDAYGTGGWVASENDLHPVIDIDFKGLRNLSGIIIQGQQDEDNWVTEYTVQYSVNKIDWNDIKEQTSKEKVFKGNSDRNKQVTNWFTTLVEAQYLRIKPISYHGSSFAMRLEVIGCPITFEVTTPISRVIDYCPELPEDFKVNCPSTCPDNTVCDGNNCIDVMDCPCYIDGVKYELNIIHETADCQECICSFGNSKCNPKNCPPCPESHKKEIKENCECVCKLCDKGTIFCPTSGECIDEDRWCDGKQDCPDDEDNTCTTTVPEITITPSPEPCIPRIGEYEAVCETSTVQFLTFDGNDFVYDICNHILFRDKENQKYVVKIAKDCSDKTNFCRRYLEIKIDGFDIIFGPGLNIQFRGTTIPSDKLWLLSRRFKKFQLMQMGETIRLISLEHGFEIIWNKYNNAKIKVSKCLMHSVNGLCGLYNGIKDDDFEKVDGTIADTVKTFGDSWSVGTQEVCYESTCPPEIRIKADEICNSLKDPIFDNCNRIIDINRQIEFCLGVACECVQSGEPSKCLCQALEDFVHTCEQKTGYVMEEWRVNYNCVPECPPGLEWRECGPSCELTCDNFQQKDLLCSKECVPGCFCPPGLLRHGDICIKAEKCHDCICSGHGDPNYITFDEREYAFQGMCTYVLARSNDLVGYFYEFEVLGINTECPEEPGTACTAGLIVNYKNNVIRIYRGEAIRFNDQPLAYEEYPFYANGINITVNPGKSALVYIADINLIVRYFESNYGFVVELPSKFYYNATEGLCGICNFVQSDDFYHKDGYIEKDVNEFASSWFVKNNKESRQQCKEKILEPPNPNPEICIFTENNCDLFVNPGPYVKSCENDVGYSRNQSSSVCHSKLQYAQKCCEKGIILDEWLAQSGCLDPCQENMVFQCTSHCQYSCDNYKAVEQFCEVPPEYQCSCPEGKVLKDGSCVDPIYCQICDSEGHRVGDRWEKDQCTVCECLQDLTVNCLPKSCPEPPECTSEQTLKIDTKTECCVIYTCVDVARTCDKKCNPNEELIIEKCICKPKEKCMYKHEYQIENGVQVAVREENVVTYLIGQKWIDGLCKNCTCKDDEGLVTTYCQTEKCPTPVESNDYSYETIIKEGECCPEYTKVFCIGDKQYKEGEEWSMGEKCVKYKCVNGDNGLQKIRQEYECDITCAPNFRYVEPSPDSENCCGHCTQVACEENGKIYDVGQRWTSEVKKCYDAECAEINGVTQIVYTTVCKSNIENCPKDQIILDETGCCQICRLECNPQVIPPDDTNRMFYFNDKKGNYCYNTYPLHNVTVCSGKCLSEVRYDYDTDYFDGMCRCCVAKETLPMSIEFECRDGSFLTKQYRKPVSCECTKCKGLIHEEEILERTPSK